MEEKENGKVGKKKKQQQRGQELRDKRTERRTQRKSNIQESGPFYHTCTGQLLRWIIMAKIVNTIFCFRMEMPSAHACLSALIVHHSWLPTKPISLLHFFLPSFIHSFIHSFVKSVHLAIGFFFGTKNRSGKSILSL